MKNLFTKLSVCLLMASSLFLTSCSTNSDEAVVIVEKATVPELLSNANKLETTWTIKRYVFNRSNGANGLGHVGVGLEIRSANPTAVYFYGGGVENEKGSFAILPGSNNFGWAYSFASNAALLSYVKNTKGYNRYKFESSFKTITYQRVVNTINELNYLPNRGYLLAGNNCMNAVYDVLNQGGGLFIPAPTASAALYAPNTWYGSLINQIGWSNSANL